MADSILDRIGKFVACQSESDIPPCALDLARQCLVDWFGVCIGASLQPEAVAVSRVMCQAGTAGPATLLCGGSASARDAALANGLLSHVLDFDDTHVPSILHGSGPIWAALLAVGESMQIPERTLLAAFVVGFQVGARLGDNGIGERLTRQGWHATPVLGRIAAAAAVAHARGLGARTTAHAVAVAASQVTGFTASFGSMAKPLNVGRAASDAVLAVELAEASVEGPLDLLEGPGGAFQTLLQQPVFSLHGTKGFSDAPWEVMRNSFKPYASCQLTHAAIDAARDLLGQSPHLRPRSATVRVHPLAMKIAGRSSASTPNEGKFSLKFCTALALTGHACSMGDFTEIRLSDPGLRKLADLIALEIDPEATRTSARLVVTDEDGRQHACAVDHAFGSIENPMQWERVEQKFKELAGARLSAHDTGLLFEALAGFGELGGLRKAFALAASRL